MVAEEGFDSFLEAYSGLGRLVRLPIILEASGDQAGPVVYAECGTAPNLPVACP